MSGTILFSPDHNQIIYRVPSVGGDPVAVTALDSTTQENSHRFPVFLPDGEHFLYFARRDNGAGVIRLSDLSGANMDLVPAQSNGLYADGHLFYLRERTLMAHPFDAKARAFSGDAFPVAENVEFLAGAAFGVFSASEHGELVYLPDTDASLVELTWYDRTGKLLGTIDMRDYYEDVSVSPDGKQIAVEIIDPETGQGDIWVIEEDRESQTRLTFAQGNEEEPVWSPDGKEIVYAAVEGDEFVLYRKEVFGGAEKVELRRTDQAFIPQDWSPDGSEILCYAGGDLWIVPLDPELEPLPWAETEFDEATASLSPDGKWIAYSSNETGVYHAYVTAYPESGRKWQISGAGGGFAPHWSAGRSEVGYGNPESNMVMRARYEVDGDDLTFSRPEAVFSPGRALGGAVTDDGERYLLMQQVGDSGMVPLSLVVNWRKAFATE